MHQTYYRIWAVWTHRYHSYPDLSPQDNVLYILRFVVESQVSDSEQFKHQSEDAKAVIQAAQAEALEWQLHCVKLWNPPPLVLQVVQ